MEFQDVLSQHSEQFLTTPDSMNSSTLKINAHHYMLILIFCKFDLWLSQVHILEKRNEG